MSNPVWEATLNRKDLRIGRCWWHQGCEFHLYAEECCGVFVGMCLRFDHRVVDVSAAEAFHGGGRACRVCGSIKGSYICDGLPPFQATTMELSDGREALNVCPECGNERVYDQDSDTVQCPTCEHAEAPKDKDSGKSG